MKSWWTPWSKKCAVLKEKQKTFYKETDLHTIYNCICIYSAVFPKYTVTDRQRQTSRDTEGRKVGFHFWGFWKLKEVLFYSFLFGCFITAASRYLCLPFFCLRLAPCSSNMLWPNLSFTCGLTQRADKNFFTQERQEFESLQLCEALNQLSSSSWTDTK